MSDLHAGLPLYVDGELSAEAAARFGDHLAGCAQCQRELRDLVYLDVAAARALEAKAPPRARVPRVLKGRWQAPAAVTGILAAAASLLLSLQVRELRMLNASTRPLELRLPHQPHQRLAPSRGAAEAQAEPPPPPELPPLALGWLKWRGDGVTIAGGYLLRGQTQAARQWLDRSGPGADVLSARAALDLLAGKPEDAVRDADQALRLEARHPTALWNRALALRALELPLAAAQAFEAVAALDEPGWAEEARGAASRLREESERRRRSFAAGKEQCRAAMRGDRAYPLELADGSPRLARVCFYDVLRASGTAEALAALEPLAAALDARSGGREPALTRDVAAAKAGATAARKALSLAYARHFEGGAGAEEWLSLASAARAARQPDIELGALYWVPAGRLDLERYRALALGTKDPWFAVLAEERAAEVDGHQGQPLRALDRLLPIEARCRAADKLGDPRVEDRCLTVERAIAYNHALLHQTAEARGAGLRAVARARVEGDLRVELGILEELAQAARLGGELAVARTYLEEVLAREPGSCEHAEFARAELALAHQRMLDVDGARREVDALARCDQAPSLKRMFVLADLQRSRPRPEDEAALRRGAEVIRARGRAGDQPLVTHVLGRAALARDRALGERLLRQAIAEAEKDSSADRAPGKARLYSYTALILDAGRRGEHAGALSLFAEERGWASPPPCSVWMAADDERLLVLSVDAGGKVLGRYDGARRKAIAEGEVLVPPELLPAVRGCPAVQVIARPPLEGRPGLLPPDLAWSEVVRLGAVPSPGDGPRVVVASPSQPASLGLPRLSAPRPSPGEVRLEGPAATPSRVLQAARSASVLELHVHGLQDPEVADASSLVLSPEPSGRFALAARDVRKASLSGRPLVLLAACHSGDTAADLEQGDGLPVAFVQAGARAVLAVNGRVVDPQSEQFFRPLLERIQSGAPPAVALRDSRVAWRREHGPSWADQVTLFE